MLKEKNRILDPTPVCICPVSFPWNCQPGSSGYRMIQKKGGEDVGAKRVLDEKLIYEILSVVEEIPEGKVATYGQIAAMIGKEKNARLVGKVLGMAEFYGDYPCHRVVNHAGRLVPGWMEQRELLEQEQVPMKDRFHVDLKNCRWEE